MSLKKIIKKTKGNVNLVFSLVGEQECQILDLNFREYKKEHQGESPYINKWGWCEIVTTVKINGVTMDLKRSFKVEGLPIEDGEPQLDQMDPEERSAAWYFHMVNWLENNESTKKGVLAEGNVLIAHETDKNGEKTPYHRIAAWL